MRQAAPGPAAVAAWLAAAAWLATATAADWPSSGGDPVNTGHAIHETEISRDTVGDLVVRWQFRGGPVYGTPVVADGTVYIADAAGALHARDARGGWYRWRSVYRAGAWELGKGAAAAPAVAGDSVYVADQFGTVRRFRRADGRVLWATRAYDHPNALVLGDPLVHDGAVLVPVSSFENDQAGVDLTMRGSVVALDAETGAVRWRAFTTSDQTLAHPKWGAGVGVWSSPAIDVARDRMYIGTGQHYEPGSPAPDPQSASDVDYSDSLIGIDLADGSIDKRHQFTEGDVWGRGYPDGHDWDVGVPPNLVAIPKVNGNGTIDAVAAGDKEGTFYVLDRTSMQVVWSRPISRASGIGGIQSTAAYADGAFFVAGHELYDGRSFDDIIPPGESFVWLSSPEGFRAQQQDGRVQLMALDAATGDVRWSRTLYEGVAFAPVVVAGGAVFLGTADGRVRAFDADTGDLLWQTRIGTRLFGRDSWHVVTAMSIADGRLFVAHVGLLGGVTVYGLPD